MSIKEGTVTRRLISMILAFLLVHGSQALGQKMSDKKIGAVHVEEFGVYHALADIARKAGVVIGVDAIQPQKEPTVVFDFDGGTVGNLLNMFVSQVKDYQWQEASDGIIHVTRRGAHVSLLDVVIAYPGAHDETREKMSDDISGIPEVSSWLSSEHCSRDQFSQGNEFRSHNGYFSVDNGSLTIQQLLDQIAAKSGANFWAVLQSPQDKPCRISIIF